MDKYMVYLPEVIHTLIPCPGLHTCACTHGGCDRKNIAKCQEHAICNPAELAKVEAEARIGRAVREFVTRQKTADYYRRTTSDYERGYKDAVDAVAIAIAKAREGRVDG